MDLDLLTSLNFAFLLLLVGIVTGFLSGMLGIGGGIFRIPALFFVFSMFGIAGDNLMQMAIGTSLASSVFSTRASSKYYEKKRHVDKRLYYSWLPSIILGVVVGALMASFFTSEVLAKFFSIFLFASALMIMAGNEKKASVRRKMPGEPFRAISGAITGVLSSILGIGGATIIVPIMTAFGKPIKKAVGTAAALSFVVCLAGALSHAIIGVTKIGVTWGTFGYLHIPAFLLIGPISYICGRWGASFSSKMKSNRLKIIFAFLIILISVRMFISAWNI